MLLCLLANLGYAGGDGSVAEEEAPRTPGIVGGGFAVSNLRERFEEYRIKRRLERELEEQLKALREVERKKEKVQQKAVQEDPPQGILANLHKLEVREQKIEARIETLQLKIDGLEAALQTLVAREILDSDDDDFEVMILH